MISITYLIELIFDLFMSRVGKLCAVVVSCLNIYLIRAILFSLKLNLPVASKNFIIIFCSVILTRQMFDFLGYPSFISLLISWFDKNNICLMTWQFARSLMWSSWLMFNSWCVLLLRVSTHIDKYIKKMCL